MDHEKIVCELCEGTEFVKDGGMFVCQGCGTKYTAEEARAMMKEVEGGPVVTGAPVGNVNQQQLDNLLLLASNAYAADNQEEAEKYCNRAIEYDAMCYKAWFLKGKAIGWSSTVKNPRIAEAAHSFKQAVDFAPDEEKESLAGEATEELKRLGLASISLRKKRFSQYPDDEELNGFTSDMNNLINGLAVLNGKEGEAAKAGSLGSLDFLKYLGIKLKALAADIPKEYLNQIAEMMDDAATEGFRNTTRKYDNDNRPMPKDFQKTLTEIDNCYSLLDFALDLSSGAEDKDIKRHENKIRIYEYANRMTAYSNYSDSYRGWMLTDAAKQSRRDSISSSRKKVQELRSKAREKAEEERKKAEEAKQARIEAYWAAHPEEKSKLEGEKKQLEDQVSTINAQVADLNKQIEKVKGQKMTKAPSDVEADQVRDKIAELEERKRKLGIFAGKEKKQLADEIEALSGRMIALRKKAAAENKAVTDAADQKIKNLREKKNKLADEITEIGKRMNAIDAELTKDPE